MKSQKEIIKDALLRGETLDQLSMLFDYGVGNHTAIMTLVRRDLQESGISVVTEWKVARSRKTGRKNILCYLLHPRKAQGAQAELESNTQ